MKVRKAVADLLAFLEAGFPAFTIGAQTAGAWSEVLGQYTDAELRAAGRQVLAHVRQAQPSAADVVTAIEGRVETRKVPRTDAHGNAIPGIGDHVEVRVGIDGRPAGRAALSERAGGPE